MGCRRLYLFCLLLLVSATIVLFQIFSNAPFYLTARKFSLAGVPSRQGVTNHSYSPARYFTPHSLHSNRTSTRESSRSSGRSTHSPQSSSTSRTPEPTQAVSSSSKGAENEASSASSASHLSKSLSTAELSSIPGGTTEEPSTALTTSPASGLCPENGTNLGKKRLVVFSLSACELALVLSIPLFSNLFYTRKEFFLQIKQCWWAIFPVYSTQGYRVLWDQIFGTELLFPQRKSSFLALNLA